MLSGQVLAPFFSVFLSRGVGTRSEVSSWLNFFVLLCYDLFCFALGFWLVGWLVVEWEEEYVCESVWLFCEEKNCAVSDLDGGV